MGSNKGFSLLELLIVVAIIGFLMTMYLSTIGKVQQKAHQVAAAEGMRQEYMSREAEYANIARAQTKTPGRAKCRAAFRQNVGDDQHITMLLYKVGSDAEFRAYWNTLINPDASGDLTIEGGRLLAEDEDGNEFVLRPIKAGAGRNVSGSQVMGWEFLSTNMGDMNSASRGGKVLYGDGRVEFVKYPGPFPMTRTVAELSRRFVVESD